MPHMQAEDAQCTTQAARHAGQSTEECLPTPACEAPAVTRSPTNASLVPEVALRPRPLRGRSLAYVLGVHTRESLEAEQEKEVQLAFAVVL